MVISRMIVTFSAVHKIKQKYATRKSPISVKFTSKINKKTSTQNVINV